eukprot:TRINITY_DN1509_c1_g2_i1.p1 TRINITY_DN1509_c1_g2~~TRINITY_DN1509_c1_g2_i1.p1  ORF type:complete len:344 (+),score=15.22 TRINITY_DN1509_c1_g2_i1:156-1187(+)
MSCTHTGKACQGSRGCEYAGDVFSLRSSIDVTKCAHCDVVYGSNRDGKTVKASRCKGCLSVSYCSVMCQRADWAPFHRTECKKQQSFIVHLAGPGVQSMAQIMGDAILQGEVGKAYYVVATNTEAKTDVYKRLYYATLWLRMSVDSGGADHSIRTVFAMAQAQFDEMKQITVGGLLQAANQGHPESQFNLGSMYHRGEGVRQNEVIAAIWYEKAANLGLPEAQMAISDMYMNGAGGLPVNMEQGRQWAEKAVANGNLRAYANLARYYREKGNLEKSAECCTLGADHNTACRYNLGCMYLQGHGVAKDPMRAKGLLEMAAAEGHAGARGLLAQIHDMMMNMPFK